MSFKTLSVYRKRGTYFTFDFGRYSIHFDNCPFGVSGGGEGGLLNGQNPLSVMEVICRQSLTSGV